MKRIKPRPMPKEQLFPITGSPRRFVTVLTTILAFLLSATISLRPALGQDPSVKKEEKAVALVNGFPIFPSDLNCAIEAAYARKPSLLQKGPAGEGPSTLKRLIDIELLYQESLKHRFPGLVEETEELFEREIEIAGSVEKLRSTLMCNNISLPQFRKSIFRNTSINRLLKKEIYSRITVNDMEIEEYYRRNVSKMKKPESVRLRQIFIQASQSSDEESLRQVENRAKAVFKQAVEGGDFVLLARKYSDDPKGASAGGEMGVIFKGNFHKRFESLVFSVTEGSVAGPVRSSNGYHIFQVVSFSPASPRPLNEVRPRIATLIQRSKARSMVGAFISSLREKADILILRDETINGGDHEPSGRFRK